jgi:hypothetical protein
MTTVRFSIRSRNISLLHSVETGCGIQPTCYTNWCRWLFHRKFSKRDADSPPSNAEFNGAIPPSSCLHGITFHYFNTRTALILPLFQRAGAFLVPFSNFTSYNWLDLFLLQSASMPFESGRNHWSGQQSISLFPASGKRDHFPSYLHT